tara:strand:+ start:810 stop:1070 length:261 start_codon:yes stop_codon:yes gene_type:complete
MKLFVALVVVLSTLPFSVAGKTHGVTDQGAVRLIENGTIIRRYEIKPPDVLKFVPDAIIMFVIHDRYIHKCAVLLSYQNASDFKAT